MTGKELSVIYDVIRKAEFRRRELQRIIVQKRDDAAALHSSFGGVKVSGGVRVAPQERYIDKVSDYEEQLTRIVRNADELARRFFYDVQRIVPWSQARAINGYLTCAEPYGREYLLSVNNMAHKLTESVARAAEWDDKAKEFTPERRCYVPPSKPITKEQRKAIGESILREVRGRRLSEIVKIIRMKCRRRNHAEKGSREDEMLYAQICALEREYVYSAQMCLTEKELLYIELYMTDELTRGEIRANAGTIKRTVEKLSAAQ